MASTTGAASSSSSTTAASRSIPTRIERSIRPLLLTRKNALFAGHDLGAEGWAMIASLIETCKLNRVDPLAWMTDVLTKLVNLWPASRINELMPWTYPKQP